MSTSDRRDEVDTLLRAAGAAWRATQPGPPQPDLARLRSRRLRGRWVPVLAAASVGAIAVAVAVTVLPDRSGSPGPVAGGGGEAQYLVRDGDRVEVTGKVIAAPERPVVYCPPLSGPSSDGAPSCPADFAVTLTGVDLGRLAEPGTTGGVRFGYARLRGIWHDHTIAVDEQSTPAAGALNRPPDTDPVPCPEPAGGWPVPNPPRNELPSTAAVERLVEQQPERFGATWVAFPDGMTQPGRAWTVPVVLVVNLLEGDVDQARRDLQPLYDGTLCISPGRVTHSRLTEAAHKGLALARDTRNGIWAISGLGPTEEETGREPIKVHLIVVDERLYGEFQKIGLDLLLLYPAVRPIR
jgi:hypothetical protein